jgi:hypothetical protein
VFSTQIEDNENCSVRDFKHAKNKRYCRVPEWVLVSIHSKAWMMVHVQFDGRTDEQTGNCRHSKQRTLDFFDKKSKKMFSDANLGDVRAEVSCWDEAGREKT